MEVLCIAAHNKELHITHQGHRLVEGVHHLDVPAHQGLEVLQPVRDLVGVGPLSGLHHQHSQLLTAHGRPSPSVFWQAW